MNYPALKGRGLWRVSGNLTWWELASRNMACLEVKPGYGLAW